MQQIEAFLQTVVAFSDAHPVLFFITITATLNVIGRKWTWFQQTLVGRLFIAFCSFIGADALGLVRFLASLAATRALGLAASNLGTTPEALQNATQPPTDRPTEPPTDAPPPPVSGGLGRRL